MAQAQLEQALRDFEKHAKLIRDDGRRQVWRFDFENRGYFLTFYPRRTDNNYFFRGGWALREFLRLQQLQREKIPSPRAVAQLAGFNIKAQVGDALIVEAIDGAINLEDFLDHAWCSGDTLPNRREIALQVVEIVKQLGLAKLGHRNLQLNDFLISDGKIYFDDARGLREGGLRRDDLLTLGHYSRRFATMTELLRGWRELNPDGEFPRQNPRSQKLWRYFVRETRRENADFGLIRNGEWSGYFTKSSRFAQPWSSRLNVGREEWEKIWPALIEEINAGKFQTIKQDASGEVLSQQIELAGKTIDVIIKRPRRKYWRRYLMDLFRPARAERMWIKAWTLISRNLPCEWPMILMQKKVLGYATDSIIVFERVSGERLDKIDLDAMQPQRREMLFRRAGRFLRAIERGGLVNYDSKSTNWIVFEDENHGAIPVMIDVDGIRPMNLWLAAWGIHRLLRAMKQHPQYTPADSLALCQGFAPYAGKLEQEKIE
ncbi:MAG TPA: lipopolysaccharide kinase InaA family protein [Tepidisphaeraceae bacterium]|nr:lipopolysaccharide kinase InaA family protein [Tepidisphaeraceae bacterium]